MLAVAAKVANLICWPTRAELVCVTGQWAVKRCANSVATGHLSRNSLLATQSRSCLWQATCNDADWSRRSVCTVPGATTSRPGVVMTWAGE
jgi:hypothetical protein